MIFLASRRAGHDARIALRNAPAKLLWSLQIDDGPKSVTRIKATTVGLEDPEGDALQNKMASVIVSDADAADGDEVGWCLDE